MGGPPKDRPAGYITSRLVCACQDPYRAQIWVVGCLFSGHWWREEITTIKVQVGPSAWHAGPEKVRWNEQNVHPRDRGSTVCECKRDWCSWWNHCGIMVFRTSISRVTVCRPSKITTIYFALRFIHHSHYTCFICASFPYSLSPCTHAHTKLYPYNCNATAYPSLTVYKYRRVPQ